MIDLEATYIYLLIDNCRDLKNHWKQMTQNVG